MELNNAITSVSQSRRPASRCRGLGRFSRDIPNDSEYLAGIRNIYVSAGEYRRPFPLPVGVNRPPSVSFLSKYHALR